MKIKFVIYSFISFIVMIQLISCKNKIVKDDKNGSVPIKKYDNQSDKTNDVQDQTQNQDQNPKTKRRTNKQQSHVFITKKIGNREIELYFGANLPIKIYQSMAGIEVFETNRNDKDYLLTQIVKFAVSLNADALIELKIYYRKIKNDRIQMHDQAITYEPGPNRVMVISGTPIKYIKKKSKIK